MNAAYPSGKKEGKREKQKEMTHMNNWNDKEKAAEFKAFRTF